MAFDQAYLERRIREERELAEKAADPAAYRAHVEIAREYERQLTALGLDDRLEQNAQQGAAA